MSKNRVKEIRLKREVTQKELADLIGTTQSYVAKIENGLIGLDIDMLPILAKALNCKPYELLPEEHQPQVSEADLQLLRAIKTLATDKKETETSKDSKVQKENQR